MGMRKRLASGLCLGLMMAGAAPAVAGAQAGSGVWDAVSGPLPATSGGSPADIQPDRFRAFTLDQAALATGLATAPKAGLSTRATGSVLLTLPTPDGGFERFEVYEAPIMEPGLAAKHPDIKTYAGRGVDDPAATVRADTTRLGFHASVRSPNGNWYIDPYYHLDDSVYISYFTRDLGKDPDGVFVENEAEGDADPLDLKPKKAAAGPSILLRTFRLALITDPTYSTYFGGPANVTAAKVALMNRVNQIYEDETAIRLILVADTDKTNLNTAAEMTGANGPCGTAACYTAAQASGCTSGTLTRNRIVLGQIIGAGNYDVGHIGFGLSGGGVASLGVVGGNSKAQGCTGLPTPVGDFYAVDYVSHEMGHQFAGNHTFNGTQSNCSGGNRNAATSVEPGSGSSIMAYAGICQQDNLQPHSDPYWSQRSYDEITALVTGSRPNINEVQNISLRDFAAPDSLKLTLFGKTTGALTSGANYTAAGIQAELQGPSEVQTVALAGYDTNGDAYRLSYKGANTVPIVRGQNNTAAGIQNAVVGGNEQQNVALAGFSATTQSFQVQINGANSATLGLGGLAVTNGNVATAINGIAGFAGTVTSSGAGNTGFTLTFSGASAGIDVPSVSIVNCTLTCASTVRETAKGGPALAGWPTGATLAVGTVTDAGYTLTIGGTAQGSDFDPFSIADPVGTAGTVTETVKGAPGILPVGATAAVSGFGGAGTPSGDGFQVTFGGALGLIDVPAFGLEVTGGTGFVGETAHGGPIQNNGFLITDTGNHAPDVVAPASFVIPPRTPFALTGGATDSDGDVVTYMWEQNDRGAGRGHGPRDAGQDGGAAVPAVRRRRRHQLGRHAQVPLSRPQRRLDGPDPRLPGHGPDLRRQHQCGYGPVPDASDGSGGASGHDPRVLLRVPADLRLDRLPRRSHAELPSHGPGHQARRRRHRLRGDEAHRAPSSRARSGSPPSRSRRSSTAPRRRRSRGTSPAPTSRRSTPRTSRSAWSPSTVARPRSWRARPTTALTRARGRTWPRPAPASRSRRSETCSSTSPTPTSRPSWLRPRAPAAPSRPRFRWRWALRPASARSPRGSCGTTTRTRRPT